jgi:8-oxo-dGTP pyrophosphatase MutT (NUDIX family)
MRMPPELAARARALVYGGDWVAPEPRPASTVVLLRDGSDGLEVALLQRSTHLGFARGMYVFPGGALDPDDSALGDPWRVAAVRETFEECGVLLSTPAPPAAALAQRERNFGTLLAEFALQPDLAALHPFAHWVTPAVESRRFDTRFFAAALPPGQDLAEHTSEHQNVGWFRPADTEGLPMLPPTAGVLAELRRFSTATEALSVPRTPVPILPTPVPADGDIAWVLVDARTGEPL